MSRIEGCGLAKNHLLDLADFLSGHGCFSRSLSRMQSKDGNIQHKRESLLAREFTVSENGHLQLPDVKQMLVSFVLRLE